MHTSIIQHVLRKAATESKAMGRQTYREMNVAQEKYEIDRVSLCPLFSSLYWFFITLGHFWVSRSEGKWKENRQGVNLVANSGKALSIEEEEGNPWNWNVECGAWTPCIIIMYTVDAERWSWICSGGKGDTCYESVLSTIVLVKCMHVDEQGADQDPTKKQKVYYTIIVNPE